MRVLPRQRKRPLDRGRVRAMRLRVLYRVLVVLGMREVAVPGVLRRVRARKGMTWQDAPQTS